MQREMPPLHPAQAQKNHKAAQDTRQQPEHANTTNNKSTEGATLHTTLDATRPRSAPAAAYQNTTRTPQQQ